MPSLDGITVRVFCDGAPLEEFSASADPDDPSLTSCWIPSTTDKEFSVHYGFETQQSCGWVCQLYCDEVGMRGTVLKPQHKNFVQNRARSGDVIFPMVFSEVVETDSQEAAEHMNPDLGMIEATIWRIEPEWKVDQHPTAKITLDSSPVHESTKMLGGHRVKLGVPEVSKASVARAVLLDPAPYRVLNFYYRPLSLLRALRRAPPPSSNPATAIKRSASVLSEEIASDILSDSEPGFKADVKDERIAAIKKEIDSLQEQLVTIGRTDVRAPSRRSGRKAKRLKREEIDIVVPPGVKGEVVDLCSD